MIKILDNLLSSTAFSNPLFSFLSKNCPKTVKIMFGHHGVKFRSVAESTSQGMLMPPHIFTLKANPLFSSKARNHLLLYPDRQM